MRAEGIGFSSPAGALSNSMQHCNGKTDDPRPGRYAVGDRDGRLDPRRTDRLYWHLSTLRDAYQEAIGEYLDATGRLKLLDYGCGQSPYATLFDGRIQRYDGADLPGNDMAAITLDGDGRLPQDIGSYDVVLSSQVLEHVPDPGLYLRESYRALVDGGLLMLSTHGSWRFHPDPTDFWRWTSMGLQKQLREAGFELLSFNGIMGPLATSLQLMQDSIYPTFPRFIKPPMCFLFQLAMRVADRITPAHVRDADACVYVVVARKVNS